MIKFLAQYASPCAIVSRVANGESSREPNRRRRDGAGCQSCTDRAELTRLEAALAEPAKWGQHPVPPRTDLFTEQTFSLENAGAQSQIGIPTRTCTADPAMRGGELARYSTGTETSWRIHESVNWRTRAARLSQPDDSLIHHSTTELAGLGGLAPSVLIVTGSAMRLLSYRP